MKPLKILTLAISLIWISNSYAQDAQFGQAQVPATCSTLDYALGQYKYLEKGDNQKVVATWFDEQTTGYVIILFYEEQNALELIAMNPRRNIFCIVTGGSIRYTFPGLLDILKAKPL